MFRESFPVGPLQCNCTILGDEVSREAIVVDPGGDVPEILARLARHRLTVRQIIVTHAHIDHVAGAIHLGKGIIERDAEQRLPDKAAEIILYCGGGFRSALAADNLQKMGYTNVLSMDGGIRDWRNKGYPLTNRTP